MPCAASGTRRKLVSGRWLQMATILNDNQPVTTEAQLNAAIEAADKMAANGGALEIDLGGNITLNNALDVISLQSGVTLDIKGDGFALNGAGTYSGLFVYSGVVAIESLTVA